MKTAYAPPSSTCRASNMEQSPYDSWADIYDSVYSYIRADIPLYTREAVSSGGPVLELGVGTGRVAIPTARLGIDVVGIDSSEAMLAVARSKLDSLGPDAGSSGVGSRRHAGHRSQRQSWRTSKVPAGYHPFQGIPGAAERGGPAPRAHSIRRHLTPGGKLIFSMFVPDPNLALEAGDVPRHVNDVTDPDTGTDYVLYQQVAYDTHHQIVSVRMIIEELDQDGAVVRKLYRDYQLRYSYRWEVYHLLRSSGFEIEALYGDFDYSEFDEDSAEMIWVARKV